MRLPAYPKYTPSGIEWLGDVPEHWTVRRLKFLLPRLESGVSVNGEKVPADDDSPGVLKTSCVYGNQFRFEENKRVIETDLERVACAVTGDSVIVSRMNTPELVGSCGYVSNEYPNLFLPDRLWIARFGRAHHLSGKYAWYLLTSHAVVALTGALATGTSGSMKNLSQDAFLGIDVPAPQFEEQHAIVSFLDRETAKIDTLVAKKGSLIERLKEKRTALISRMVTRGLPPDAARAAGLDPFPKLKPSGIEWLGDVPEHWRVLQLRHDSTVLDCKHKTVSFVDDGVAIASIREVHDFSVDLSTAKQTTEEEYFEMIEGGRAPRVGDIIYSRNATVGDAAIVDSQQRFCMGQDVCLIRSPRHHARYLLYLLRSAPLREQAESLMIGSTFRRINVGQIKGFWVCLPPRAEQKAIANYLDLELKRLDDMIIKVDLATELLQEYRTALVTAAVTGKIDVVGAAAA